MYVWSKKIKKANRVENWLKICKFLSTPTNRVVRHSFPFFVFLFLLLYLFIFLSIFFLFLEFWNYFLFHIDEKYNDRIFSEIGCLTEMRWKVKEGGEERKTMSTIIIQLLWMRMKIRMNTQSRADEFFHGGPIVQK